MPYRVLALGQLRDRESLYAFLRDHLRWPVDPQDTFTYAGPQLHGPTATRAEVEQIIPFGANDPFAILLVEFETEFRRGDLREILRAVRDADRCLSVLRRSMLRKGMPACGLRTSMSGPAGSLASAPSVGSGINPTERARCGS